MDRKYAAAPDFSRAFDHILMHCGGKAIIDSLEKGLHLTPRMSQPTRDALYRFGNTSSASTFYVLSRIESSSGVRKGDRIWHLSFGGGFKVILHPSIAKSNLAVRPECAETAGACADREIFEESTRSL
jgi:3-ketoacyl-CoA synthase